MEKPRDFRRSALDKLVLAEMRPRDLVSPNFRFYELTRSETAERLGIDNSFPTDSEFHAGVNLARNVLQPIRNEFGAFTPNSVFRSQALDRAIKHKPSAWVSRSQHTMGCACDVEIVGLPTMELARWAAEHLPEYDQIICECYDRRRGPNSGWVHISLLPPKGGSNRKQLLTYLYDPAIGRNRYIDGLEEAIA